MYYKPPLKPDKRVLKEPIYALPVSDDIKIALIEAKTNNLSPAYRTINDLLKVTTEQFYKSVSQHLTNNKLTTKRILDDVNMILSLYGLYFSNSNFSTYNLPLDFLNLDSDISLKIMYAKLFDGSVIENLGDLSLIKISDLKHRYNLSSEQIFEIKKELAKYGIRFESNSLKSSPYDSKDIEELKAIKNDAIEQRYQELLEEKKDFEFSYPDIIAKFYEQGQLQ